MTFKILCFTSFLSLFSTLIVPLLSHAKELQVGDPAPSVELLTSESEKFNLMERKGKWTVLYFYPKADTPGCTKQACAFRDNVEKIRKLDAEVYGVSADDVNDLKKFKEKHKLNFPLLADPKRKVIEAFGAAMPLLPVSKRWTFIIGPDLKVAAIEKDVDPAKDAQQVAQKLKSLLTK